MFYFNLKKFKKEVSALRSLGQDPEAGLTDSAQRRIRVFLLQRIKSETPVPDERYNWWRRTALIFRSRYVLASLAGIFLVVGAVSASGSAVPGDVLFPLKKAEESVRLVLTPSEVGRAELQAGFAEKRLSELNQIENAQRVSETVKAQAQTEVAQAVNTLVETRDKLQADNHLQAVAAVTDTIDKLVNKFETSGVAGEAVGVVQKTGDSFNVDTGDKTLNLVSRADLNGLVGKQVNLQGRISGNTMAITETDTNNQPPKPQPQDNHGPSDQNRRRQTRQNARPPETGGQPGNSAENHNPENLTAPVPQGQTPPPQIPSEPASGISQSSASSTQATGQTASSTQEQIRTLAPSGSESSTTTLQRESQTQTDWQSGETREGYGSGEASTTTSTTSVEK